MSTIPRSQNHLADLMNLSKSAVSRNASQGMPTTSVEAAQAWRQARQNIARRKPGPRLGDGGVTPKKTVTDDPGTSTESHDAARTRREVAEADLAELKLQTQRGLMVLKSEVDSSVFEISRAIRDGLTNCARRIAADVAGLDAAPDCEVVIDREHRALMQNMVKQFTDRLVVTATEAKLNQPT